MASEMTNKAAAEALLEVARGYDKLADLAKRSKQKTRE